MSRQQRLAELLGKKLFKLRPLPFPGDDSVELEEDDLARQMYVSSDVLAVIMPPFADTHIGRRLAEFRNFLDAFMLGSEFSVSEDPDDKPSETMLARVAPVEDEFWSLRVTGPEDDDKLRSLGAFHDTDEFIALIWEYREVIDRDFQIQVDACQDYWRDLFDPCSPHRGDSLDEYLSESFYVATKA